MREALRNIPLALYFSAALAFVDRALTVLGVQSAWLGFVFLGLAALLAVVGAAQAVFRFRAWISGLVAERDDAEAAKKRIEGDLHRAKQQRDEARASGWDDPNFKHEVVNKKIFRKERVPLDGILYTNCTFENVTFVYEGKKPYGLVGFRILGKDTDVEAGSAPLSAFLRLLHVLGYIKHEIELGDELRPDARVVRVEGGQVEVLESTDEERERLRAQEKRFERESNPRQLSVLRGLCLHLGADLMEFDRQHRHADVSVGVRIRREKAAMAEEANALKQEELEMERLHDNQTVKLYHERYKPRIMDLYGALEPGGWLDDSDRELFEDVSDWTQIKEVAKRLRTVGHRLPDH